YILGLDVECIGSANVEVYVQKGGEKTATVSWEKIDGTDANFAKIKFDATVRNGKLCIRCESPDKAITVNFFGLFGNSASARIIITLPVDIDEFKYKGSTSKLFLDDAGFKIRVDLQTDVGDITVRSPLNTQNLSIKGDVGNIVFNAPGTASQTFAIKSDVGAITTQSITAETVHITSDVGAIKVDQITGLQRVSIKSDVGSITVAHINTPSLTVKSDVGSIKLPNATVTEIGEIKSDVGSIAGSFASFKNFNVSTDVGSINVTLAPAADAATKIESDVGKVTAVVTGFNGIFKGKSDMGKVSLRGTGSDLDGENRGTVSCMIGAAGGKGAFAVKTDTSRIEVTFVPSSLPDYAEKVEKEQ
ncbi:hypothetical protein BCR33DRAFT_723227, partial [Rhizoclosmatium globosum]